MATSMEFAVVNTNTPVVIPKNNMLASRVNVNTSLEEELKSLNKRKNVEIIIARNITEKIIRRNTLWKSNVM